MLCIIMAIDFFVNNLGVLILLIYITNTDEQQKNTVLDFDFIYNKYCNNVWIIICKSIFDVQQREEVMQDVFVKFYKSMGKFQHENAARKWLMLVTKSTIIDAIRKDTTYKEHISITLDDEEIFESCQNLLENQPLDNVIKQEIASEIMVVIRQLKSIHYEVIILHYFMEFSPKEISEKLHIPLYTVYSRLSKAKTILYDKIGKLVKDVYFNGGESR